MKSKIYIKHFLNTLLGIFSVGAIVSILLYFFLISFEKESIYKNNMQYAKYEFNENKNHIEQTINDYKQQLIALKDIIKRNNLLKNKELLKDYMQLLIKSNNSIFQIRYLNNNADEIIRIDRLLDGTIVEKKFLQNKKDRYYFTRTANLPKNEFYVSNLDLNVEHKEIEKPFRPTFRVATPLYINDTFKGILIFNFNAKLLIDKITQSRIFNIYYMDEQGNFLLHPDEKKSWSTQLKTNFKVKDEIKNITQLLKNPFSDKNEHYYIDKINITDHDFYIILSTKKVYYEQSIKKIRNEILFLFFIVNLIGFPFALFVGFIQSKHVILLEYIINSIPHPLYIKNSKGNFVLVNDELVKFYNLRNKKQLIGKNSYTLNNQKSFDSKEKDQLVLQKGILKTVEEIELDNNNILYYEIIRVKIPYYYFMKNTFLLGIAIDITQIKELNDKLNERVEHEVSSRIKTEQLLAQQSKMALMGEMIGNIAHQWRQPLSNITTISTGLNLQKEMDILNDDQLHKGLMQINESAQYLSQTIDDFRNFFKPYKLKTNFTIDYIVKKALKLVSTQFKDRNIQIIKQIEDIKLNNLENEFTQVILNLLNNARDELTSLSLDKKLIFIESKIKDKKLIFEIKDNAGGIEENIQDKIFDAYFTTKQSDQGTGIGLYMSKEIIEKHMGGKLSFKNETIKYENKIYKGACFKIEFDI
ncbi:hypothetical protein CRV00_11760 [Malaciobacter molluscorum]|uniref:sensor histidine kinase n=1 Tax=Malaciobacter molluscorum TaxID=1032072 RepID=UPI00100A6B9B|nr:ATP-binding protein [Malaciobacter molluscorum]RXJ93323.1 hypothetical protein CRV00_11760 [Malaciobacter molluscorum]